MTEKIDLLSKLVQFHEDVEKIDGEMQTVLVSMAENVPEKTKVLFEQLYDRHFVFHFTFEEMVVFPAVQVWAASNAYDRLIADYCLIHKALLAEGKRILEGFGAVEDKSSGGRIPVTTAAFTRIKDVLLDHAAHENIHIVPLLQTEPTVRFLSGRNMLACKALFGKLFPEG